MVHQPYEGWLLDDEHLTPEQERELRTHLRICPDCAALARSNLALRAAPVVPAPQGFTLRFQQRLAAQRKAEAKRARLGIALLALSGAGALLLALRPFLPYLALGPEQLFAAWVSHLLYAAFVFRTLSAVGLTLLSVADAFLPDYAAIGALALFVLFSAGLKVSIRKVGQLVRSPA